jgi:ketosteroid isomerase-like protein
MKNRLIGALALFVALGAVVTARADDAEVQKALQANYDRMSKALREKDLKTLIGFYAPDYQSKGIDGETTDRAAGVEARLKGLMEAIKSLKTVTAKIDKITVKGDEATVAITQTLVGTVAGADGNDHALDLQLSGRATWIKTADGWRLKRTEALREKGTIDGNAVDRSAAEGKSG